MPPLRLPSGRTDVIGVTKRTSIVEGGPQREFFGRALNRTVIPEVPRSVHDTQTEPNNRVFRES